MSWPKPTNATAYEGPLYAARFRGSREIFAYLDQRNPRAVRKTKAFIKHRIASLGENPERSRLIKQLGVHAHWLGRYPYIIYYRVVANEVRIIHIRHAARRPWESE